MTTYPPTTTDPELLKLHPMTAFIAVSSLAAVFVDVAEP